MTSLQCKIRKSSEAFCFEAIEQREDDNRPFIVWYLCDFDRAGWDVANALREKLERFAFEQLIELSLSVLAIEEPDVRQFDATLELALVNVKGISRWLPTGEHKRKSAADRKWRHPFAIELDAIEPGDLRRMVWQVIEVQLLLDQLEVLKVAELGELDLINSLIGRIAGEGGAGKQNSPHRFENGIQREAVCDRSPCLPSRALPVEADVRSQPGKQTSRLGYAAARYRVGPDPCDRSSARGFLYPSGPADASR